MALQPATVTVDLTDSRRREAVLVYEHDLQEPVVDDNHPAAYLHWASRLGFNQHELTNARREGGNTLNLERLVEYEAARKEMLRSAYQRDRTAFRNDYIAWAETAQFDLVVCCPSSRGEAQYYLGPTMGAVRFRKPCAVDVSRFFRKKDGFYAGAATSIQQVYESIEFNYDSCLDALRFPLIIDDVWNKGWTVGAVLSHLFNSGLQEDCHVTVFAPLLIPRQRRRQLNGCEY